MPAPSGYTIEAVWRRLEGDRAEQLVRFWVGHGALDEAAARRRLGDVVCLLLDERGEIAGVNSVYDDRVPIVGNRRFWIYRMFLAPGTDPEAATAMVAAARDELERHHSPGDGGPIGLCLLLADPELMRRHPEAFWPEARMIYAGYTPDGRQIRLGYFEEAVI